MLIFKKFMDCIYRPLIDLFKNLIDFRSNSIYRPLYRLAGKFAGVHTIFFSKFPYSGN